MHVYRASEFDLKGLRTFPWKTSLHDVNCRYYDFKKHPELIETSLEDFIPWTRYPATQEFYDMLRWINGSTSELETDDCAFGGIKLNGTPAVNKTKQADGRIMVFYRRLQYNCTEQSSEWLADCFEFHLKRLQTDLEHGVVGLSKSTTFFTPIQRPGVSRILNFWSWGDDEEEVMNKLQRVFKRHLSGFTVRIPGNL